MTDDYAMQDANGVDLGYPGPDGVLYYRGKEVSAAEWPSIQRDIAAQRSAIMLPLSVPDAIRLHGYLTTTIARDTHKLNLLVSLRIGITDTPDLSEDLLAANIRNDGKVLDNLTMLIYGGTE